MVHAFLNGVTGFHKRPDSTKSEYNSRRRSIHLLIKRGLLEQYNEGKYLKKVILAKKGYSYTAKLIFDGNAGFMVSGGFLYDILRLITKKNFWLYTHIIIVNGKVDIDSLDKRKLSRNKIGIKDFAFTFITKENDEIVIDTQQVRKELKGFVRKNQRQNYIVSIEKHDPFIWLRVETIGRTWGFLGAVPEEFIPEVIWHGDVATQTR